MIVVRSAVARVARIVMPSFAILSVTAITGCATSSFGGSAPGYDEQACVERALRRTQDRELASRAAKSFRRECLAGGAEACSAFGVMNELGVGVPANQSAAIALYARSCAAGNSHGCANLGIAAIEGIGGVRDVAVGANLLELPCRQDDARACFHLGRLHLTGDGLSKDRTMATELFERACAGDEPLACVALGGLRLDDGKLDEAANLYGKACSLGDASGCRRLDARIGPSRGELATRDQL